MFTTQQYESLHCNYKARAPCQIARALCQIMDSCTVKFILIILESLDNSRSKSEF
eukprot:jgi/Botrbrau1/16706/Bobra.0263s0003.1